MTCQNNALIQTYNQASMSLYNYPNFPETLSCQAILRDFLYNKVTRMENKDEEKR